VAEGENGTRELFLKIVQDEERHTDYFKTQLALVRELGIQDYLSGQIQGEKHQARLVQIRRADCCAHQTFGRKERPAKMEQDADRTVPGETPSQLARRCFLLAACSIAPALALADSPPQNREGGSKSASLSTPTGVRVDRALRQFEMGFHCAQSVLEVYAADFGIDPMVARRMANALAGGSGVGGECGAVAVGYLVLGLRHGNTTPAHGDVDKEAELFGRISRFVAEFKKRHGAITCRELLGVDVFTEEGREEALRKDLIITHCPNYIRDAITIVDSLG
jgi:C_GCAxxG_C_C family probable redox protein